MKPRGIDRVVAFTDGKLNVQSALVLCKLARAVRGSCGAEDVLQMRKLVFTLPRVAKQRWGIGFGFDGSVWLLAPSQAQRSRIVDGTIVFENALRIDNLK